MRAILQTAGALVLLSCAVSRAADWNDVWSLGKWREANPEQAKLVEAFDRRVLGPGSPIDPSPVGSVRIAVAYPAMQDSDYWRRNVAALRARLDEIGLPYELETYYSRPGDVREQAHQLRRALDTDPDYLVCTLDAMQDATLVERLLAKGRPRVILQNITTPLCRFGARQPLMYVGFDHEEGSRRLAEYFLQAYPEGAKWALLLFTRGYVSNQRGGAFQRAMNGHPFMRLEEVYLTEGRREKARQGALDALSRHGDLDFFFACSTDVALGAVDALQESGRTGEVWVNGWGGGKDEIEAVSRGDLAVTVMRMNDDAGVAVAEAISLDARGRGGEIPAVYSGAFEIVTRDMTEREIERLEERAFRYSGWEASP